MNSKSIFKFLMIILLAFIFVSTGTAYGYTIVFKGVISEHVGYDTNYFSLGEITYITGGITLEDVIDPESIDATLEWDTTEQVLPFAGSYGVGSAFYQAILGYVPPTSFSDWEDKTYTFKIDGIEVGNVFITPGTFRELSLPVAAYDDNTKTVSWQSVESADEYRVRILQSVNVDEFLFNSERLGPEVNQYTFDESLHSLLYKGGIIAVEARDWNPPFEFLSNTSIYVTYTPVPIPDIKANGSDGPISVTPNDSCHITISLDPGDFIGQWSDWWIGVMSSYGTIPILGRPIPIFELPEITLFDTPLPTGIWLFYFILDDNPNGSFDRITWYDYVVIVSSPE